jgi:hypothetical protein
LGGTGRTFSSELSAGPSAPANLHTAKGNKSSQRRIDIGVILPFDI